MFKKKKILEKLLFGGVLLGASHILAVELQLDNTQLKIGGFVTGMYAYQDNATNKGTVYKPRSAKRQTSIKDTKARGGFRDESTRLKFEVKRKVGEKSVKGKIEWEFDGSKKNSAQGLLDYRVAWINIKFNDRFDLTLGRNWDIFGKGVKPYINFIRNSGRGQGFAGDDTSNQILAKYKWSDSLTLSAMIGDKKGADRETKVAGDFDQQPLLIYHIKYKKGKGKTNLSGLYQRKVGSRPNVFNDEARIRLDKTGDEDFGGDDADNVTYRILNKKTDGSDGVVGTECPSGWTKDSQFCKRSRPLFYDGSFASMNAYFLYLPESGVDRMGYDYDSVGYSLAHEIKLSDRNKISFGVQAGLNLGSLGYSGMPKVQRYSVLDEVNSTLIGQYSQIQDRLNDEIYKDIQGKEILGSIYQTKSVQAYNFSFKSYHKLTDKLNLITWFGQTKVTNPKNLKPNNGDNGTDADASLKRANYLAYAGSSGGSRVENNLLKYTFEYTPFKGQVNQLKFFLAHSHLQTTYANTEVQNNSTLAAVLPYLGKDLSGDEKTKNEEARNEAFEESLRRKAGKTAIANDISFGAKYSF